MIYHMLINMAEISTVLPLCFHFCDMHMQEAQRQPCSCGECGADIYVPSVCNCLKPVMCVGCESEQYNTSNISQFRMPL